ncbi:MAG: hypothetical protein LQ347_000923 [Umbilicaria vellea]|nr:MAG: hypothetical protein LQ347_000923 [Umbilicaria vellea]
MGTHESHQAAPALQKPPMPEVASHLTIGFNSTNRQLEEEAQRPDQGDVLIVSRRLAAVFVPRSDQASILASHVPLLVHRASLARPALPATRLVNLSKGAEARLCAALHLPRVTFVGLFEDAPNATPLIDFVRERVAPIEVPWLKAVSLGLYMPVEIKAIETTAPAELMPAKRRQERSDVEKIAAAIAPEKRQQQ